MPRTRPGREKSARAARSSGRLVPRVAHLLRSRLRFDRGRPTPSRRLLLSYAEVAHVIFGICKGSERPVRIIDPPRDFGRLLVGELYLVTVSICNVKADGTVVWEGKALSEPASLIRRSRVDRHLQSDETVPCWSPSVAGTNQSQLKSSERPGSDYSSWTKSLPR